MRSSPFIYILPLIFFGFYSGFFFQGKLRTETNKFNYYRELAVSLGQGRLDIACPPRTGCHDIAEKDGKYYIYYGPVPALFFFPLVSIWKGDVPDSLIAAVIGCLNVFLFLSLYRAVRASLAVSDSTRENKRKILRARVSKEDFFFGILWGLGTVHCYMTMHGDVWHLSQVCGQTFLLAALRFAFTRHRFWLAGAALCFAAAVFTRYALLFGGVFFLFLIYLRSVSFRDATRRLAVFAAIFAGAAVTFLFYNYARFGNVLESGLSFMKLETVSGVAQRVAEVGTFSLLNFLPNLYHEIFKAPEFTRTFPFVALDPHGFGILWNTPVYLLLIFPAAQAYRRYRQGENIGHDGMMALAALLALAATSIFIFMLSAHGFMQYSARYTLDFQVFPILILAMKPGFFSARVLWSFLAVSVYMNLAGAYLFMKFFTKGIS